MKKEYFRFTAIAALCLLLVAVLAGCGGSSTQAPQTQQAKTAEVSTSGLKGAAFEQPVLITSIGQSADGQMVKSLAERSGLKYTYDALAKPEDAAKHKTLILVVGGSSKGLGAAGINVAQEEQRAKALIAKAQEAKLKIIVAHVGGESRRGEMTDRFVTATVSHADYMIVVADGDKDKIFAKAAGSKIPVDYPKTVAEVGNYLKAAFKQ
jgi:hypothetical protein